MLECILFNVEIMLRLSTVLVVGNFPRCWEAVSYFLLHRVGEQGTPWQPGSENDLIPELDFTTHDLESTL